VTITIPRWARNVLIAGAVLVIALHWLNTRITILRDKQRLDNPVVLTTYDVFHDMAPGLAHGRLGQVDLLALGRHAALNDPWAPYERLPPEGEHRWVNYYTLDIGYSFIVEAARLAFPSLPDNHVRSLALQLLADAAMLVLVFFLFSQWNLALGLLASYLYASDGIFLNLVSFAFYYYWDIPLTFLVLGCLLLAYRRPNEAVGWLALAGAALGLGVWIRASWWPLSAFLFGVTALTPPLRKKMLAALMIFVVIAIPQVVRSSRARGQLALSTRATWHVALVGLGYYPNPYGLERNDGAVFKLTREKYGVEFRVEDYGPHDQAARAEFFSILKKDPGFVVRSFLGRLQESVRGHTVTSVLSFLFLSNGVYRLLCLLGFALLVVRGGDRRLVGVSAAGVYVIYVVLTCLFYFVALAYENVSEATLFILFMGVFDYALELATRLTRKVLTVA
jgi:hypothetical protein